MPGPAVDAAKPGVEAKATVDVARGQEVRTEPIRSGSPEAPRPPAAVESKVVVATPLGATMVGEKVPRVIGPTEAGVRRAGGAFLETFIAAVKSRPVQVVASFGVAFVAAGLVVYLAPRILTTLLTTAGASAEQATWIVWALAIIVGIIVFVVAWKLIKPAVKVVK